MSSPSVAAAKAPKPCATNTLRVKIVRTVEPAALGPWAVSRIAGTSSNTPTASAASQTRREAFVPAIWSDTSLERFAADACYRRCAATDTSVMACPLLTASRTCYSCASRRAWSVARFLPRLVVERSHHRRARVVLAHIEEHRPRRRCALPVLRLVLEQALQEQRIGILRPQLQDAVERERRAVRLARAEEHDRESIERGHVLPIDLQRGLIRA